MQSTYLLGLDESTDHLPLSEQHDIWQPANESGNSPCLPLGSEHRP